MNNEIQLISDGDGLALIGNPTDVERFLISQGLDQLPSRDLGLQRLGEILSNAAVGAQTVSTITTDSGRWVQISESSFKKIEQFGLMTKKDSGLSLGVVQDVRGDGKIKGIVEFANGPGSLLGNPAILTGAAGIMAQMAIEQQMEEIVEYLQEINEKVDDILRCHKDAVLADMIGVDLIIEEAWTVRDRVGRVSEVTWSKVQGTSMTIARTQGYALRQLDAIAEKLEKKKDAGELAKVAKDAEAKVREWLAVLARCFQLQDAILVLELDRVLDASPMELDQHRLGLTTARQNRFELIARSTTRLLTEMDETVRKANSKVLFNPFNSPAAVRSSNQVSADLHHFRGRLGIESVHQASEARLWGQAATEMRDRVLTTTGEGVNAARRFGADTYDRAAEAWRPGEIDGDGVPDKSRALSAVQDSGSAIKGAAADAASAIGTRASSAGSALGGLATGAKGAVGSFLQRKRDTPPPPNDLDLETAESPE
ncbi:MAG: hypothetical protein U1E29_12240 [Coriobacteriia bacterium]|nr:hypothetical protein [Coriobacteriia bacterium]